MSTKAPPLSVTDLRLIRQTYYSTVTYRMPYLPAPRWCYRAKALADRGLLKAHATGAQPDLGKQSDWARYAFSTTPKGVRAYNAAMRAKQ
jgi:hypothetical protein